jgi:hypothetical protein
MQAVAFYVLIKSAFIDKKTLNLSKCTVKQQLKRLHIYKKRCKFSKRTQAQSHQQLAGTRANESTVLPTVANKNI